MLSLNINSQAIADRPLSVKPGTEGSAKLVVDRPGEITIESDTKGPMVAYLTERFHVSWKLFVDGVPHVPLRVNAEMLGAELPAGKHRLELKFYPDDFWLSVRITKFSLVLYALVIGFSWLLARRERQASAVPTH